MGTGSKLQPTVYDLSDKSLAAQAKFLSETHVVEIQVQSLLEPGKDEKVRVDNRKHLENILKSLHNLVSNELRPILLKERVTKEEQKEIDDKKFFKEFKLHRTLKAIRTRMQLEEAIALMVEKEKLKEKMHELKELMRKLADAKYAEDVEFAEAQRIKFEQEIHALIMADLNSIKNDAQQKWDGHQDEIDKTHERLAVLRNERARIIQEHKPVVKNATDSFFQTSKASAEWSKISDVKKDLYAEKLIEIRDKKEANKLKLPALKEDNADDKVKLQQLKEKRSDVRKQTIGDIATTTSATQQEKSSSEFKGLTTRFQLDRSEQRATNQNDDLNALDQQIKFVEDRISARNAEISAIEQDKTTVPEAAFMEVFDEAERDALLAKEPDLLKNLENHKPLADALDKVENALQLNRANIHKEERTIKHHEKAQEKIVEDHKEKIKEVASKAPLAVDKGSLADFRAQRKLRNPNPG